MENIHSTGYIHLDIKLDNIMISESNEVILIDYGQARKYLLENGSHCPNTGEMEDGNIHFASPNAFKDQTLSRRDDLIQVMYNIMLLENRFRPIQRYIGRDPDFERFLEWKIEASPEEFCIVNRQEYLIDALNYCFKLGYEEEPNYDKLKFILKKALLDNNKVPGGRYL